MLTLQAGHNFIPSGRLILIHRVDRPECAMSFRSYLMWSTSAFGDLTKFMNSLPKCWVVLDSYSSQLILPYFT